MPCLVTRVQAIDQRVAYVLGSTHTATGRADVPDYRRISEALFVAEENITLEEWVAVRRRTATHVSSVMFSSATNSASTILR